MAVSLKIVCAFSALLSHMPMLTLKNHANLQRKYDTSNVNGDMLTE